MPDFTFQGPGGKQVTVTGPAGATREQAIQILNQHLGEQPQQPIDKNDYYSKLSGMLDGLQQQLAPSWNHNNASYSPYKPAQPGNMPNDAINPVGNDTQMATAAGVGGGLKALASLPQRPQPPPPQPPVNMNQLPTQQSFGAQMSRNVGQGQASPTAPTPQANPGIAAQQGLLRQVASEALKKGGSLLPFPLNHVAKFAPRVLGLEK